MNLIVLMRNMSSFLLYQNTIHLILLIHVGSYLIQPFCNNLGKVMKTNY